MNIYSRGAQQDKWWVIILTALATILVLWAREPNEFSHPQFWAEDGVIFFSQARENGLSAIAVPYGGYYHLVQRIAAGLHSVSAPSITPRLYFLSCIVVHLVMVGLIFSHRLSLPLKPLVALAIVATPTTNEIFLSLTNIQWIFALSQVLVLLSAAPVSRAGALRDLMIVLFSGLTGPFVAALLPIYAFRALHSRLGHYRNLFLLAAGCAAIQIIHSTKTISTMAADWFWFDYVVIFNRLFSLLFLGSSNFLSIDHYLAHTVLAVMYACLILYLVRQSVVAKSWQPLILVSSALLLFAAAISKFYPNPRLLIDLGLRYYYLPSVLLLWAFIAYAPSRVLPRLLLALVTVNVLLWDKQFTGERVKNLHWVRHTRCIGRKPECIIPINPSPWAVIIKTAPEDIIPPGGQRKKRSS
jgi:hypothetical protein